MRQVDPMALLALSQKPAIWKDRPVQMTLKSPQLPLLSITDAPALLPEQRQKLVALVAELLVGALSTGAADE
jgi:hypothetical protein